VTSNAGPIILSLEKENARYVATGFEMFPYAAGKSPALSILSLNIFKWLSGHGVSVGFNELPFMVGSQFEKISDVLNDNDIFTDSLLTSPGVYRALYRDNRIAPLLAFNFFSESESDKNTRQTFSLSATQNRITGGSDSASSFAPLIILVICSVVSIDLIAQMFSVIRRRFYRV
jgi:hypothetical protein